MIDTHCHIHVADYRLDPLEELKKAQDRGVEKVIVIGQGHQDSLLAQNFAQKNDVFFSIGLHPHQASSLEEEIPLLIELAKSKPEKLVAIGECGLDYYYLNSDKKSQKKALIAQIELAQAVDLPLIFHLRGSKDEYRDAYDDFYEIFDNYKGISGVVHSFTATEVEVEEISSRGLYIGLNGIITFTKDAKQIEAVSRVPLDKILFETDAPYLTPHPFRGTINTPQYVVDTAQHISHLRGESFAVLETASTQNAKRLFRL